MSKLLPARIQRDPFGSMFDEFFTDVWARPMWPAMPRSTEAMAVMRARMDVVDKGASYAITIEMPGVRKEDINVSIDGARVSIAAETVREVPVKEGEKLLHSERYATSYARSFELPGEVTESGADAVYEDGVLTLMLPKRTPSEAKKLQIH